MGLPGGQRAAALESRYGEEGRRDVPHRVKRKRRTPIADIFIIGSAIGPNEVFFKEGFGESCDEQYVTSSIVCFGSVLVLL